jgi:hypothetical protein
LRPVGAVAGVRLDGAAWAKDTRLSITMTLHLVP